MRRLLWIFTLCIGFLLLLFAAREVYLSALRGRQIFSHATLQVASGTVMKRVLESGRPLTRSELFELVEIQAGEDGWGELVVVDVCDSPDGERSYLFISKGSDRRLDVEDVQRYCGLTQQISVAGDFPRDLVFRDRSGLRTGGK